MQPPGSTTHSGWGSCRSRLVWRTIKGWRAPTSRRCTGPDTCELAAAVWGSPWRFACSCSMAIAAVKPWRPHFGVKEMTNPVCSRDVYLHVISLVGLRPHLHQLDLALGEGRRDFLGPPAPEPGGSACCYWDRYGTQCDHPAQRLTRCRGQLRGHTRGGAESRAAAAAASAPSRRRRRSLACRS